MVQFRLKYIFVFLVFLNTSCEEKEEYKFRSPEEVKFKELSFERIKNSISDHPQITSCLEIVKKIGHFGTAKLLDVRKIEDFEKGHIPGAIQVWRNDFNEERDGLASFCASKNKMEALLSRMGIENEDTLILYDGRGGANAARFWFVLKFHGFDQIKFLNGGIEKWKTYNFPLDQSSLDLKESNFRFKKSPEKINIELEELLKIKEEVILLDSRTLEEFSGKIVKNGASKGGRIPNAIRFDFSELTKISKGEDHCFREAWEVKKKLQKLNIDLDKEIIVYCQSGARSALLAFYFREILDMKNVRNYDGSWIEWSHNDSLAFEKG